MRHHCHEAAVAAGAILAPACTARRQARSGHRPASDLSFDYRLDHFRPARIRPENQVTQSVLMRYSFGS